MDRCQPPRVSGQKQPREVSKSILVDLLHERQIERAWTLHQGRRRHQRGLYKFKLDCRPNKEAGEEME